MSKHTPGPWIRKNNTQQRVWSEDGEKMICSVSCGVSTSMFANEYKANYHLIAAAPELLEALKDMLAGWRYIREAHGDLYGVGWDRAQQKAESAIAKAEGV